MTLSYTLHLRLAVPDFLSEPWHGEFAQAMDSIDQAIFNALISANTTVWLNSHAYTVGQIVIDPQTGIFYTVAIAHTTDPAGTFAVFLAAHPTFYTPFTLALASQAEAEAGIENTKYMSALRVAQAIVAQSPIPGIASQPQAEAGIDNITMMTPLRTAQAIALRATAPPQGRLGLVSADPVSSTGIAGLNVIFYTPYLGQNAPFYDGVSFANDDLFGELLCITTDTAKNPAAIGGGKVNDWFLWKDSNVVTISIAVPAVVSWTAHGMPQGQPFRFTTTGALPTGVSPDTTYFVLVTGLTANSFQFSLTKAGAAVNTSGSQSGVHTIITRRLGHGPDWTSDTARSAGTALTRLRGIWVNNVGITNGPAAQRGTYVGTTRSNASSTLDFTFVGAGSGGVLILQNVWNCYNRIQRVATCTDTGVPYTYSSPTIRQARASANNQINFVIGIVEDPIVAYNACSLTLAATALAGAAFGVGLNSSTAYVWQKQTGFNPVALALTFSNTNTGAVLPILGYNAITALQNADGNTHTYDNIQVDQLTLLVMN